MRTHSWQPTARRPHLRHVMLDPKQCPAPEQLADFLSGSLALEHVSVLESHLSECSPCHDTLLELGSQDTFEQLAIEAFNKPAFNSATDNKTDQAHINLVAAAAKAWPQGNQTNSRAAQAEVKQAFDADESGKSIGIFGQFRIDELLGSGSSGVVYLATDITLDRQVALKILRPSLGHSAKARFLTEAKATAAMDHPNVVSIHQVGVEKGMAFIAMKWTPGETLASRMADGKPMPVEAIRTIGSQIAAGLAAAHDANLIHRDIKPANIWLEESTDNVRILDFGLVRASNEEVSLTLTGMLAGTPSYMSPEQTRGGELDSRSDLFSLGCVLYQMLSGELPFQGNNVLAMLQSIQKDTPPHPREPIADSSEELSALVMSLLQKSPADRPPSASMVSAAIQSDLSQWPFVPSVKPRSAKSTRVWNPLTICGVVLAACILGMAAFFTPQIIRIATDQQSLNISFMNDIDYGAFQNDLNEGWVPTARIQLVSSSSPEKTINAATVHLYKYSSSGKMELISKSEAKDGIVEYKDLFADYKPEDLYRLMIRADGYASVQDHLIPETQKQQQAAGIGADGITHVFSLADSATLSGTVVDHKGNPVEGATVFHYSHLDGDPIEGFENGFTSTQTRSDGTFSIDDFSRSSGSTSFRSRKLRIRHPEFGPQYVIAEQIPGDIRIQFDPPRHVKFQVIDGGSRRKIAGYQVVAQVTDSSLSYDDSSARRGPGQPIHATSDEDGWVHFIVPSTGSYCISHMPTDDQEKYPRCIQLAFGNDGNITLDPMKLEPAATITGNVVDENGMPVPKATIVWSGPDLPHVGSMMRSVRTGRSGNFNAKVVPGENRFCLLKNGWRAKECRIYSKGKWIDYSEFGKDCITIGSINIEIDSSLQMQFVVSKEDPNTHFENPQQSEIKNH